MITTAPLPCWSHLLRALWADPVGNVSPWLRPWDTGWVMGRSAWSLAAVAQAVAKAKGRAPRVLLPGWICNQSLWPLRQLGAELVFLPVGIDGHVEWRKAPALGPVDMVVVVHSFGRPAPLAEARALADKHGALLVEDAAHALAPVPGIGEAGDVVLYSPHKLLALPDGAVVVVRPRAEEDWAAEIFAARADSPQHAGKWLARRLIQKLLPDGLRPLLPQGGQVDFLSDPSSGALPPPCRPTALSRRLMGSADLTEEAKRRKANFAALARLAPAWFEPGEAAPYRFVFAPERPAEVYARIRAARLPVESWPDLPPEVMADPGHAEGAVALRRSLLLLPVHGALESAALARAYAKVLS
ncbi:putative glycosyltransferase [Paramagnetospirillum magnetotacticum MS-1]|uniref:Putative glycosyltransferase n=1 Tax=Paramagnetospirillum magnetotacticum MS-1 TaxID=272627 RepID=A0A0C2YSL2_PARME|nr:DegT/DnrJ/EryC1/StrS family aminotransferase [Paramagnetospirillum magnetotacticum]KIL97710.1 putative glycosyltransferase [Paramagnetospirillum magnetotacticum MS-1]